MDSSRQGNIYSLEGRWMALRKALKEADPPTLSRFCLHLQILALSLYPDYRCRAATELLARDEVSMLRTFFENDEGINIETVDYALAGHILALGHGLFEASGGTKSDLWHHLDDQFSAFENQATIGLMAGADLPDVDSPEEAHAEQLYHAISGSKLFALKGSFSFVEFEEAIQKCRHAICPSRKQRASGGLRCDEGSTMA